MQGLVGALLAGEWLAVTPLKYYLLFDWHLLVIMLLVPLFKKAIALAVLPEVQQGLTMELIVILHL